MLHTNLSYLPEVGDDTNRPVKKTKMGDSFI